MKSESKVIAKTESEQIKIEAEKMKTIDASGHYESDDETGFIFEQLKSLQLLLDNIFEEIDDDTEDNIEEKVDAKTKE